MKVTFVNPFYRSYVGPLSEVDLPPLCLANCATILQKRGFDIEIVDANIQRKSGLDIARAIGRSDVFVVTTSSLFSWQCPPLDITPFHEVMAALRNKEGAPLLISVGPHSCIAPRELADVSDIVVLGQPEPFFERLRPDMVPADYYDLDGIAYLREGMYVSRPPTGGFSLSRMPSPNLRLLPYMNYRLAILPSPIMMIETSRGCPERCPFCFQGMTSSRFDTKSVGQVIDEIRHVRHGLGIRSIFFIDLELSAARPLFEGWMREVVRQGIDIQWACQIRMSSLGNDNLVGLMAEAGCKIVCVGLESMGTSALEGLSKNRSEEFVLERIRALKRHGIKVMVFFLIGSSFDRNVQDIEKTIAFARRSGANFASFNIARPYPGTPFFEIVGGMSPKTSFGDIHEIHNPRFSLEQLTGLRRKAYLSFYLRPGYLFSHLSQILRPGDYLRNLRLFFNILIKTEEGHNTNRTGH